MIMAAPKSLLVTALLTFLVAVGPLSTDLYLPSLPAIGAYFDSGPAEVQLTLSVFLIGFAVSQLAYGPLSDRFGRRPMLLAGLSLYLVASLACCLAPSLETLIAARFLQAVGGCAGPVLGRAVVRDVYGQEGAARVLSYMSLAMALAPALGPILGGYLEVLFGWRANFAALSALGLFGLVSVLIYLPETNAWRDETATQPRQIAKNYRALLADRVYVGYLLVVACAYSGIFAFISGSSFVLIETLGLTPSQYGLCFATFVLGYMVGTFISGRMNRRLGMQRLITIGAWIGCLGGLCGLVLALAGVLSVTAVVAPLTLFIVGAGLMLPNALAGAIGPYAKMAGSASALLGFFQMSIAALVGIGVGLASDGTARPMAAAVALVAIGALAARRLTRQASRNSR